MWNDSSFCDAVALNSFTGTLTSPKLIEPVQMGLATVHLLGPGKVDPPAAGGTSRRVSFPDPGRADSRSSGWLLADEGMTT
jgi:hypothetical protein